VIAHKGYSTKYPENTPIAFSAAYDAGADGVELDVQMSRDGVPVVIHDHVVGRTGGPTVLVGSKTVKELRQISVHNPIKFKSQFYPQPICTLQDISRGLACYKGLVFIELKKQTVTSRDVGCILEDSEVLGDRRVIISFDFDLLRVIPGNIPTGFCIPRYDKKLLRNLPDFHCCSADTVTDEHLQGDWYIYGTNDIEEWRRRGARYVCVSDLG
jgi:glycerophosphoryl diester phosphodiesterase